LVWYNRRLLSLSLYLPLGLESWLLLTTPKGPHTSSGLQRNPRALSLPLFRRTAVESLNDGGVFVQRSCLFRRFCSSSNALRFLFLLCSPLIPEPSILALTNSSIPWRFLDQFVREYSVKITQYSVSSSGYKTVATSKE
ncbi:hypothetical protein SDJN02_16450, partial [Cucurbita argyrosperma subsp. argyrosperma]